MFALFRKTHFLNKLYVRSFSGLLLVVVVVCVVFLTVVIVIVHVVCYGVVLPLHNLKF
jgi:hypothetical protein